MHEFISHPGFDLIENEISILIQKQNDFDVHLLKSAKILADKVISVTQNELLKKVFRTECYRMPDTRTNAVKQDVALLQTIFADAILDSQKNFKQSEGTLFVKVNDLSDERVGLDQKYYKLSKAIIDAAVQFDVEAKPFLKIKNPYRIQQAPELICIEYVCDYKIEFPWK